MESLRLWSRFLLIFGFVFVQLVRSQGFVEDDFFLVTDSSAQEIYQIELPSGTVHTLPIELHDNPLGLQYHYKEKQVYWVDQQLKVIRKAALDGSNHETVIALPDLSDPVGLALDPEQARTYYTDVGLKTIEYVDHTGSRTLVLRVTGEPRDIVLDIYQRVMYWTTVGIRKSIERANMDDGRRRKVLVNTGLGIPNGLAIDFTSKLIFWTDAFYGRVEQASLDGKNRRTFFRDTSGTPFGLNLDADHLYLTDFRRRYIRQLDRRSLTVRRVGPALFGLLNYVHLYSSSFRNLGIRSTNTSAPTRLSTSTRTPTSGPGSGDVITRYNTALLIGAALVSAMHA